MKKQKMKSNIYKTCIIGICMLAAGICYSCGRVGTDVSENSPAGKQEPYLESVDEAGDPGAVGSDDGETKNPVTEEETKQICYVHVCGQVRNPGVYEIEAGSRIFQAVDAAGGLTEDAAEEYLNMAETVQDGMKVRVPSKEEAEQGDALAYGGISDGSAFPAGQSQKVNLNTAGKEQLMTLRGIGESRAEDIIRYREEHGKFQSIEEIMEISGIKDAAFQKIKEDITV